jgi:hypothetical protein
MDSDAYFQFLKYRNLRQFISAEQEEYGKGEFWMDRAFFFGCAQNSED